MDWRMSDEQRNNEFPADGHLAGDARGRSLAKVPGADLARHAHGVLSLDAASELRLARPAGTRFCPGA
jgi:hypothetical protein